MFILFIWAALQSLGNKLTLRRIWIERHRHNKTGFFFFLSPAKSDANLFTPFYAEILTVFSCSFESRSRMFHRCLRRPTHRLRVHCRYAAEKTFFSRESQVRLSVVFTNCGAETQECGRGEGHALKAKRMRVGVNVKAAKLVFVFGWTRGTTSQSRLVPGETELLLCGAGCYYRGSEAEFPSITR